MTKAYDRAYFDRWYRSPTHRVRSPAEVARLVAFVLATADHLLGRPVRTVLDVGAGEGNWQPVLRRLRPTIAYQGVDRSEYAVRRYGRRRQLLLGDATALDALPLRDSYDLVIASGVLNYLTRAALRTALAQVTARAGGVLYLEIFTAGDDLKGDTRFAARLSADWLRRELRRVGLVGAGLHCYVRREEEWRLAEMERTL